VLSLKGTGHREVGRDVLIRESRPRRPAQAARLARP